MFTESLPSNGSIRHSNITLSHRFILPVFESLSLQLLSVTTCLFSRTTNYIHINFLGTEPDGFNNTKTKA
jgi:hypothetical protein